MICVKCEQEAQDKIAWRCGDHSQIPFVGELRICNSCARKYSQEYHLADDGYEWMLEGAHFAIGNIDYTPTKEEMDTIGTIYRDIVESSFVTWTGIADRGERRVGSKYEED